MSGPSTSSFIKPTQRFEFNFKADNTTGSILLLLFIVLFVVAACVVAVYLMRPAKPDPAPGAPCSATKRCAVGTFCVDAKCVEGCESEVDCTRSQLMPQQCDISSHKCFGGPCRGGDSRECLEGQECVDWEGSDTKLCVGLPLPATPSSDASVYAKAARGLSVTSIINWLVNTGVPASKIVIGISTIGQSLAPVTSDANNGLGITYAPDLRNRGAGPVFGYRDTLAVMATPVSGRLAFIGDSFVNMVHNTSDAIVDASDVDGDNDGNTYAYVPSTAQAAVEWVHANVGPEVVGGIFLSFETQQSALKKTELAITRGLGGVMVNSIEGDADVPALGAYNAGILQAVANRAIGVANFIVAGYFGDAEYVRDKECVILAPVGVNLTSLTPLGACSTVRNVGQTALLCTHVHYGSFTISYYKPASITENGGFYVDTTDALRDFGWRLNLTGTTAEKFPASLSAWDGSPGKSCISPSAKTERDACAREGPQTSKDDLSWACWNDQPQSGGSGTQKCHAAGFDVYGGIASKKWLQDSGKKVLASIGGVKNSAYFSPACSDAYLAGFVSSIVDWVTVFNFDGVDINWQFPTLETRAGGMLPNNVAGFNKFKNGVSDTDYGDPLMCTVSANCNYTDRRLDVRRLFNLVAAVRAAFDVVGRAPEKHYLISLSISADPVFVKSMEYAKLAVFVDYFNVLCYNLNTPSGSPGSPTAANTTGVASPLTSTCSSNAQCLSGVATESCDPTATYTPISATKTVARGECVQCMSNADCVLSSTLVAGRQCDLATNTCYCTNSTECLSGLACIGNQCSGCKKDADCTSGAYCRGDTGKCVACMEDSHCSTPASNKCTDNTCVPYGYALNSPAFHLRYPLNETAAAGEFFTATKYGLGSNFEACCAGNPSVMKDGKLDGSKCVHDVAAGKAEMPWSKTCDGSAEVIKYCSSVNPLTQRLTLMEDPNCRGWCMNELPDVETGCIVPSPRCTSLMTDFCKTHPNSRDCSCLQYTTGDTYKKFEELIMQLLPGQDPSTQSPVCWDPDCAGTNLLNVLRTDNMEKEWCKCEGHDVNICQQIINVNDSNNVVIEDVYWNQVCPGSANPNVGCTHVEGQGQYNSNPNSNVCLYGQWTCGDPYRYPCSGAAQCSRGQAGDCVTECSSVTGGKACTHNNQCVDGNCQCGESRECIGTQFCDTVQKKCVDQCASCRPGETCSDGECRCGDAAAKNTCTSLETCNSLTGLCTIPCGRCTNGNSCFNGKCQCGSGIDDKTCIGNSVCVMTAGTGTGVCSLPH